jgi:hypothetical protein
MKNDTPQHHAPAFIRRLTPVIGPILLPLTGAVILLTAALPASAGSFSTDFNSGLPAGTSLYGNAFIDTSGGISNSGCLKLTTVTLSEESSFIITNDLDAGTPVVSLTARFSALIGGGNGANGISFNFAPDLPLGPISEYGAGSGMTIEIEGYQDTGQPLPGIDARFYGSIYDNFPMNVILDQWVDVFIQFNSDTTLTVSYNGVYAMSNYYTGWNPPAGSIFGLGARTGGLDDNHWIDNLTITTQTNPQPYVSTFSPAGNSVRGDAPIVAHLSDNNSATQINTNAITLTVDGVAVTPAIVQNAPDTYVTYTPATFLPTGSSHTVKVTFADNGAPPNTNSFSWNFTVGAYGALPTNLVVSPSLVSASPGFDITYSQISLDLGPTIQRAESQLAGLLIDATTGQPYPNTATQNNGGYTYVEPNTVDYDYSYGNVPGLPGINGDNYNYASEVETYLYFTPGVYTLGVASSDGFNLPAASTPDVFALDEMQFNGVRSPAGNNTVTFSVSQGGYYPFRILFFTGGIEVVNPSAGTPHLDFYSVDVNGNTADINDSTQPNYIPAFQPAATLPYIQSVSPTAGQVGVQRNAPVTAILVDGSITVQPGTVQLQVDGTVVSPAIAKVSGVTTVNYQPATQFLPDSSHSNQLAFTDSSGNRRTNSWSFTVQNILNTLWVITPTQTTNAIWQSWVTAGSTERGIVYNPQSGHVLLVSRSAATGATAPNGGGIAVLNGTNGLYITQLTYPSIISGSTYAVNMVGTSDDGVIYVCSLATSGSQPFNIYRWQNESATPTVAFSGNPTAPTGTPRWGDSFAVRGAGIGTQILAAGNEVAGNFVELFSTVDGTNFTVTVLTPPTSGAGSLPFNSAHLGLAFGCGNTFYGLNTASPLYYCSFTGPGSSTATALDAYALVDLANTKEDMGAVGIDIQNQRVIADVASLSPHAMELYDLNVLTTSGNQEPVDTAPFSTSTSSFATGSVSFTPSGSAAYCLDTANGIQAFSLSPTLAAPSICSEPQGLIVAVGGAAFFSVGAIGSPQSLQWYRNGLAVAGATNRSLSMYNVQSTNYGGYTVVISNSMGVVTSSVAYLDTSLMSITTQPNPTNVNHGATASFTVAATGGITPYKYQWALNGTNLASATNSSLVITNAQLANAGNYTAAVTDQGGQTVTSQAAALTVVPALMFTGATLAANHTITLTATSPTGHTNVLEMATNLNPPVAWQPVATNTSGSNTISFVITPSGANAYFIIDSH